MIEDFRTTISKMRPQYEEWIRENSKLAFVKELKNKTLDELGLPKYGLKDAKDFADMVFSNQIKIETIKEERKNLNDLLKPLLLILSLKKLRIYQKTT